MSDYRRSLIPGGTFFFTLVTYQRQRILCSDEIRAGLRDAIRTTQVRMPFTIDAWVLMPDHLHAIWTLPENDDDFSARWSMIKRLVTQQVAHRVAVSGAHGAPYSTHRNVVSGARGAPYKRVGCAVRTTPLSESRKKRREGNLWQRRFWEHLVRDEIDLKRCLDYLHWNPVRHGYVSCIADWPYSSFHRFVSQCLYPEDWGGGEADHLDQSLFGE